MTTKLHFIVLFLFSTICFSQTIISFTSDPMTSFNIATVTTNIDQSPTGENTVWTFNNLTSVGTNTDAYAPPSAPDLTTYPGTTEVLTVTAQGGSSNQFFLRQDGSGNYITGISQDNIILNYNTENAFIGLFPMLNGTNNSGTVSGEFTYQDQGVNGTFTGTITAHADAYGILNFNDTSGASYSGAVTRIRIDQSLSFSIPPIFNDIGTMTQTTYYYYDNTNNNIVFRYNGVSIDSSFLGVNETSETLEYNPDYTLSLSENTLNVNSIKLYPNPTKHNLYISDINNLTIDTVSIFDIHGREIMSNSPITSEINTSHLKSGAYFLRLYLSDGQQLTKRFIKQ